MSKAKKVETQDEFEASLRSEPAVYDTVALSIVPRAEGGFHVIKVQIDSKSLKAGEIIVIDTVEERYQAADKFKYEVVANGLI